MGRKNIQKVGGIASMTTSNSQTNNSRTWIALGFVVLGLMFLFGISRFFPLLIVVPGAAFLVAYQTGGKSTAPLAIPGSLITGTGFLLLFQSLTGWWESWAFVWTLFGTFTGVGLYLMGKRMEEHSLMTVGRLLAIFSTIACLGLGFLFLILTDGTFRLVLMLAFFAAGGYILWREFVAKRGPSSRRLELPEPSHAVVAVPEKPKNGEPPLEADVQNLQDKVERLIKEQQEYI
jgi:hypothetical protein